MLVAGSLQTVATIVTAFCFTMMGFIIASLSILALFAESSVVREYRQSKFMYTLVIHVALTLLELAGIFLWALSAVLSVPTVTQAAWLVYAAAGGLGMTLLCCLPLLLLQIRAHKTA